jgi:sialic acid synthase SpsE
VVFVICVRVIEKHFTLRCADVDSDFSLEPEELKMLVTETERTFLALAACSWICKRRKKISDNSNA